MRLDKYVSTVTELSRSDVKKLIKHGEVTINDIRATDPGQHIHPERDHISAEGIVLKPLSPRYFMLHKPEGVVCANTDGENPTVIDLIDEPNSHQLQIVGRLDKDTTGLVLLTDNGQWNHRITSPKSGCFKVYSVTLEKVVTQTMIEQLSRGVILRGEQKPTLAAQVIQKNHHCIELAIQEGKYHQVKRMLAAVDNHVTALFRQSIGPIKLDSNLRPGQYRALTQNEIHYFMP